MSDPADLSPPAGCAARGGADPLEGAPGNRTNREGLDQVQYRIGGHAEFKRRLLSALSQLSDPALAPLGGLRTRDDDDYAIALLDGWAAVADVLTFYHERIANESFLRTATERRSILELARLIGYELRPGVAAGTFLAFCLETAPGTPARTTVDAGTRVQSVPGPGERPQIFETSERFEARRELNALTPRLTVPVAAEQAELYLRGTATNLQPGDAVLIVGDESLNDAAGSPAGDKWNLRILQTVTPLPDRQCTRVTWEKPSGMVKIEPAALNVKVYAFRQRASLCGHNALDPQLLSAEKLAELKGWNLVATDTRSWTEPSAPTGSIDLAGDFPQVVAGGWVVLVAPRPTKRLARPFECLARPLELLARPFELLARSVKLFRITRVSHQTLLEYGASTPATRIFSDKTAELTNAGFPRCDTTAFVQSEALEPAEWPFTAKIPGSPTENLLREDGLLTPIEGDLIELGPAVDAAVLKGRLAAVTGRRLRARVAPGTTGLQLDAGQGVLSDPLAPGESLLVLESPFVADSGRVTWRLRTRGGFEGTLVKRLPNLTLAPAEKDDLILAPAEKDDDLVSEVVVIREATGNPPVLRLQGVNPQSPPLRRSYDRATVTINANVVRATQGETVAEEVLGSGDALRPFPRFALRQTPLTFVRSGQSGAGASTLCLRVNEVQWREVQTLLHRGPDERVFVVRLDNDGKTTVQFGDGRSGARLPTGQENVRAVYRKGGGLDGLVKAGQLSLLLTRPLGVKSVTNPLPPEGADEPERLENARRNAPVTVLTLGRVVSLLDYQDFARAYPGIGKARATWMAHGAFAGVFLTVAGPGGLVLPADGDTLMALTRALRAAGDPRVPLQVQPHRPAEFRLAGTLDVNPDFDPARVLAEVKRVMEERFSFEARDLGQPVWGSEVVAAIHRVPGVDAVDLDWLERVASAARCPPGGGLPADPAEFDVEGRACGAGILTLAADGLEKLGVRS